MSLTSTSAVRSAGCTSSHVPVANWIADGSELASRPPSERDPAESLWVFPLNGQVGRDNSSTSCNFCCCWLCCVYCFSRHLASDSRRLSDSSAWRRLAGTVITSYAPRPSPLLHRYGQFLHLPLPHQDPWAKLLLCEIPFFCFMSPRKCRIEP